MCLGSSHDSLAFGADRTHPVGVPCRGRSLCDGGRERGRQYHPQCASRTRLLETGLIAGLMSLLAHDYAFKTSAAFASRKWCNQTFGRESTSLWTLAASLDGKVIDRMCDLHQVVCFSTVQLLCCYVTHMPVGE